MAYNVDLPQFSGDEKEQLSQIRNFLYRQAEQLGYALNNIDSTIGSTYTPPKSQLNINEIMKKFGDYVKEAGTASGWSYKKWNNGTYEAYGTFAVTPTASTLLNTLYQSEEIEITLPFSIADDAVIYGTASGGYLLGESKRAGESSISVRLMSDDTINTAESVTLRLHVEGTLKTED